MANDPHTSDILVIGSGAAGLTAALNLAERFKVTVLAKGALNEGSTAWAQGGIAAVLEPGDTFESHIEDTMIAGAGLNDRATVEMVVENAPAAIERLAKLGVPFNTDGNTLHLTREGGHSHRRIVHVDDATGWAVQEALLKAARANPNITLVPDMVVIDLATSRHEERYSGAGNVWGVYAFNRATNRVELFTARHRAGDRRRGAHLSLLDRAARRDRRRHRDGVARGVPHLQHGDHAVPPDLPLQSRGQELPDHRGGARRGRAADQPADRQALHDRLRSERWSWRRATWWRARSTPRSSATASIMSISTSATCRPNS
jgi:glycine/D-amino acid oxidase-like deaminating enzyme